MTTKDFLIQMWEAFTESSLFLIGIYLIATILGLVFKGLRKDRHR